MKTILLTIFTLLTLNSFAQDNPTEQAQPIVAEGKRLYRSEMASWYGTDLFMQLSLEKDKIGGYFSYIDGDTVRCIFFSNADKPRVIGTMSFDSTYNTEKAGTDFNERDFTPFETEMYTIRTKAFAAIRTDTLFKRYNNTDLNLVPLIVGGEKKVYVLTAPKENGVVIFGNDYLLTFDKENNLVSSKMLHHNLIAVNYGKEEDGKKVVETIHSHSPETGDFITATDICTLMLYEKFAGWEKHIVVSKKYMNSWNCKTNELFVIPMKTIDKINKNIKKEEKKKDKEKAVESNK